MLVEILDQGNLCALFTVVLILVVVGSRLTDPRQRRWGVGLGVAAFLAYGVYGWAAFVPGTAEALLMLTVRALAAGGLTTGLAWVVLPLASFLYRRLVVRPAEESRAWSRRTKLEREGRERRAAEEARRREITARAEAERVRGEPARAEREARALEEKRRRHAARWSCHKFFRLHAHELGARLNEGLFGALAAEQLHEGLPVAQVEANATELLDLMRRHLEGSQSPASGAAEARAMVQRYYAEHVAVLRVGYPTALFEATLNALVPESAPREAAWAAARDLIGQLQEAVRQEETRLKAEERARQGRERRLRRIERERGEIREHLARLKTFDETGDGPRMEDEIERQEAKLRDLEEERENLLSLNEGET